MIRDAGAEWFPSGMEIIRRKSSSRRLAPPLYSGLERGTFAINNDAIGGGRKPTI